MSRIKDIRDIISVLNVILRYIISLQTFKK